MLLLGKQHGSKRLTNVLTSKINELLNNRRIVTGIGDFNKTTKICTGINYSYVILTYGNLFGVCL